MSAASLPTSAISNPTTLSSATELAAFFTKVGLTVGPRKGPNKRTHQEKELYNLRQYLLALSAHELLTFPITIEKSESPDFILTDCFGKVGLEITEATTPEWQQELSTSESDQEEIQLLGRDGWAGNSAERETCAAILRAIRRKVRKIKTGGYCLVSQCNLVIYVNVRAFFYNADETILILLRIIHAHQDNFISFGSITIIAGNQVYHDVTGSLRRLSFKI